MRMCVYVCYGLRRCVLYGPLVSVVCALDFVMRCVLCMLLFCVVVL